MVLPPGVRERGALFLVQPVYRIDGERASPHNDLIASWRCVRRVFDEEG